MKILGAPNGDRVDSGAPGLCVAIATLNRPEGLERCLGTLVSGECLPSEIVVVDQGASGATRQVLERFRTFGIPVIHVVQQRLGLSASRNAGG
jgi:glycosyltransferase involved in cell wall biosynthesis